MQEKIGFIGGVMDGSEITSANEIRKYVIHVTLYEDVNIKLPDNQIAEIRRQSYRFNEKSGAFERIEK